MSSLDVKLPVYLLASELECGGNHEVRFSRQTRRDQASAPVRERAQATVTVPPQAFDGQELAQKGLGDRYGDKTGDLVVIVRIKCGS